MKRGYSTEGDQMLNYIEHGVFDALEKHYLKSFVFAVYLVRLRLLRDVSLVADRVTACHCVGQG